MPSASWHLSATIRRVVPEKWCLESLNLDPRTADQMYFEPPGFAATVFKTGPLFKPVAPVQCMGVRR
jgi:hypothetical protein